MLNWMTTFATTPWWTPPSFPTSQWEYLFDSSNSDDTSWNAYNWTDTAITYNTGIVWAKMATLNWTTSQIEIEWAVLMTNAPTIIYGITRDFSISTWFNLDNITTSPEILQVHRAARSSTQWRGLDLQVLTDEFRVILYDSGNLRSQLKTTNANLSAWVDYFVAFTRSWATFKFYLWTKWSDNLTELTTTNTDTTLNTNNIGWSDSDSTWQVSKILIWAQYSDSWTTNYFPWDIDDMRISNTGWTLSEVETLYAPWA